MRMNEALYEALKIFIIALCLSSLSLVMTYMLE